MGRFCLVSLPRGDGKVAAAVAPGEVAFDGRLLFLVTGKVRRLQGELLQAP